MMLLACVVVTVKGRGLGPGKGPWETADPESFGLSREMFAAAGNEMIENHPGRTCFVAVKEGKIVHEQYWGSGGREHLNTGYSTTKSLCSSLMGVAVEEGWASVDHPVTMAQDTLKCNLNATMKNVLTMTGQSKYLPGQPEYKYDVLGTNCLDTIEGYIRRNNPEGLSTENWMLKHFWEDMGFEHSQWRAKLWLQCGTSSEMSCRDLARHAQLWLNRGEWAGVGQLLNRKYVEDGTKWVFPEDDGQPYGYTLPLRPQDAIDPTLASFDGLFGQCAFISKEHEAVIVSMGRDTFTSCKTSIWEEAGHTIVSRRHPNYEWVNVKRRIARTRPNTSDVTSGELLP